MKRSQLLIKEWEINDLIKNPRRSEILSKKVYVPLTLKGNETFSTTPSNELFKTLSYKRIGSLINNDNDNDNFNMVEKLSYHSSPSIELHNPLELEKIKIKIEKTQNFERQPKRIDPNRHLWKEENQEKNSRKIMTLRHMSEIENKTAKINAMRMSLIMVPANK